MLKFWITKLQQIFTCGIFLYANSKPGANIKVEFLRELLMLLDGS